MASATLSAFTPGAAPAPLQEKPISRAMLALFAGASGDHNPIHIDTDFARASGMDDVFAHGMVSVAYLARMLTDWVPQERLLKLHTRFMRRTPVGGAPRCTGQVEEVVVVNGRRVARVALRVELEDGEATIIGTADILLD